MGLQMRGVDHDPLRLAALARQFGENLVEHAQTAPADEPIVDRLVRTVFPRRVTPAESVLNHKYDGANDPTVIHPRDAVREWKITLDPAHLRRRQQEQIRHGEASSPRLESANPSRCKKFNGSWP